MWKAIYDWFGNRKFQFTWLFLSIIAFLSLVILRDLVHIEINKFIYVAACGVCALFLRKEFFVGFFFFVIPFHSGMPISYLYPAFVVLFLLKNLRVFKNWRMIIVYSTIPLLFGGLELLLSTLYGQTAGLNTVLKITSALFLFCFVIYDRKLMSPLPLRFFALGVICAMAILLSHWIQIATYLVQHTSVRYVSLSKLLTETRFGNITGFTAWAESLTRQTYPFKTSMYLSDNANYVGFLVLMGIMCLLFLMFENKRALLAFLDVMGIILLTAVGFYTGSKAFFICYIVFVVGYLVLRCAEGKMNFFAMSLASILFLALMAGICFGVPFMREQILKRMDDDSMRFELVMAYGEYIFQNPLVALFGTSVSRLGDLAGLPEVPHCSVVQIIGGYGLFGFAILCVGLILTIFRWRPKADAFREGLLSSAFPMIMFAVFSLSLQIFFPPNILMYGLPTTYIFIYQANIIAEDRIWYARFR